MGSSWKTHRSILNPKFRGRFLAADEFGRSQLTRFDVTSCRVFLCADLGASSIDGKCLNGSLGHAMFLPSFGVLPSAARISVQRKSVGSNARDVDAAANQQIPVVDALVEASRFFGRQNSKSVKASFMKPAA